MQVDTTIASKMVLARKLWKQIKKLEEQYREVRGELLSIADREEAGVLLCEGIAKAVISRAPARRALKIDDARSQLDPETFDRVYPSRTIESVKLYIWDDEESRWVE